MARPFFVRVSCPGNPPYQTTVVAKDEWHARTRAMVNYPHPLRGQTVSYEVTV